MEALASLADRLPAGMVSTHHGEMATHARDRWALALLREARGDRVPPPAAVVYPDSTEHVATVLRWAQETGIPVVPRGGGSGLAGGAEAIRQTVTMELSHLDRVLGIDPVSQTVRAQAGVRGGDLEEAVAPEGFTIGHDLASLHISTVGGWIAVASNGVASAGYRAIEDRLLGATIVLPGGAVVGLKDVPRTAAGPDLRRLLIGSEGTLAIVTEATLAVSRRPAGYLWDAFSAHSFDAGLALVREIVQRSFRPLVLRLLDPAEASSSFGAFGYFDRPLLIIGFDAGGPGMEAEQVELKTVAREFGARPEDPQVAEQWWDHRHDGVAWYDAVMGADRSMGPGVVVDFAEVAAMWRRVPRLYEEVRGALLDHAESVTCRVNAAYPTGASLLFTFLVRAGDDREAEAAYLSAWDAAAEACLGAGGTITHNHGVGLLKVPYLERELGIAGLEMLGIIKRALDPEGVLNPGKLLPGP